MDRSVANSTTNLTMRIGKGNIETKFNLKKLKKFMLILIFIETALMIIVGNKLSYEMSAASFSVLLSIYMFSILLTIYGLLTNKTYAFVPLKTIWFITAAISIFIFGFTLFLQLQCSITDGYIAQRRCQLMNRGQYWDFVISLLISGLKCSQIYILNYIIILINELKESRLDESHPNPDTDDEDMIVFERKVSPNSSKSKIQDANSPIA